MQALHFGRIQIDGLSKHGKTTHVRVTVSETDREPFSKLVNNAFDPADKVLTGAKSNEWKFILGLSQNKGSNVRILPGHLYPNGPEIFASPPTRILPADSMIPTVQAISNQLKAAQENITSWLG